MLHLEIITPEKTVFEGDVESVTLPTIDGEITVLHGHVPLVTGIQPGPVIVHMTGKEETYAIARGVIEVNQHGVSVLTDIADRADDLEEAQIEAAKIKAEELMTNKREDAEGFAEATAILEKELARLRTVRRHRSRRGLPQLPPTE